ncbi:MAG: Na+/H+ antiporter NhaC family protein [Bacillota bacterium]|nr:Na+/H+ antiporter NhaC family protein [Bacillota bacterium]
MVEKLKKDAGLDNPGRVALIAVICIAVGIGLHYLFPEDPAEWRALSLIPAAFLLAYVLLTKRMTEAIVVTCLFGYAMYMGTGCVTGFSSGMLEIMMDEDSAWLLIVCGTIGSIICIMERAGGARAFGLWAAKKAKTRGTSLFWSWILGIIIFIDDYMNSLTVGSCMRPLTDKHKVSREMLAYVVDSTAAPMCVLVPVTTWAAFLASNLEINGYAAEGEGLAMFTQTIPYNLYAWFAVLIVPLVGFGLIKPLGRMKKAEKRVAEGGPLSPPGSEKIDIKGGKDDTEFDFTPRMINFIGPIVVLIGTTLYFDIDLQMGVICTIIYQFVTYLPQKLMSAEQFVDDFVKGLQNMVMPLLYVYLMYNFGIVLEGIHFTEYVIEVGVSVASPATLPLIVFVALAITEFISGSNWGMYVIATPIVVPMAMAVGCDIPLALGAMISAGIFGSHICFYSDATVLTSAACGCNNYDHALSQLPYGLIAAGLAAIGFLGVGFIMY